MAELNTGDGGGKGKKVRSKKSNAGVDLTAMVDLAFLLITFFILTTTLSKPQSMPLALPDPNPPKKEDAPPIETPAWRTMTIVLGKDNKLVYWGGFLKSPESDLPITVATYGKNGIRKALLKKVEVVNARTVGEGKDPKKEGLTVIIKASKNSNYKNLIDILDEMAISKPRTYAIVEITPEDIKVLEDKKIK